MVQHASAGEGAAAHPSPRSGMGSVSFWALLLTQVLTAVNDNAFRWLVIGLGKDWLTARGDERHIGLLLTAGTACFVLPYLLLAAPAGYLADRCSKRSVLVACKVAEIGIMALGIAAAFTGQLWLLLTVVALTGVQSALFAPSKLGAIPEIVRPARLSAANGAMALGTVVAAVVGMALGNVLADAVSRHAAAGLGVSAAVLLGVAVGGWALSLLIGQLAPASPQRRFPWNAASQTVRDVRRLAASRALLRVALGIMFFWSLGALAQMNIDQFAFEAGATEQTQIVPLLLALVAGVGFGSVLAGHWSSGRVELGLLPLGAGGVAVCAGLLFTVPGDLVRPEVLWTGGYLWAAALLFLLGVFAGLFDVPLEAYLQHRSPPESRGTLLAASNFLTFSGMLLTAGVFCVLRAPLFGRGHWFTAREIFLLCAVFTVPVCVYIVWLIPQASIRFLVWLLSKTVYRIRVQGLENLPDSGGALLVANHVSWLDGILLLLTSTRPIRMIAFAGNFTNPWLKRLAGLFGVIMIGPRPKAAMAAIKTARAALRAGELVCIFPEGGITRSGQLQTFKPGLLKILAGTTVPVIPVYLDELWGSIFSFEGGRFFWKRPKRWPYPVSIHFGPSVDIPGNVYEVRRAVQDLGASAVAQRAARTACLARSFLRTCKKRKRGLKIADSTGIELSGGAVLMRTMILRRLLVRHVLADDEHYVGLLLPPSAGAVLANMALTLDRRVPINLNYSVTPDIIDACIRQAGIRHVLTSRRFMEKMKLDVHAELVYLEDLPHKLTWRDKVAGAVGAYLVPSRWLERSFHLQAVAGDDLATIVFTSGSTGQPKGVMLTQANIASNLEAVEQVVQLNREDVLVGILPFFHSFGYTIALWTIMAIDVQGVFHYSPLDGKQIGKLCKKYGGTVLLGTPTFLRTYLRRCDRDEFASLDVVVAGAEQLPRDLADAFEQKFGIRPYEGYGTTELSPLVSVNIPPSRSHGGGALEVKEGTIGRPVPGVSAKITDLDTGAELPTGRQGMLWIRGPNVMKGYLNRPEATAEVIKDGWYMTGDVAIIDDDGFITITGRESRFSKIGGEMVPHVRLEEALSKLVGAGEEDGPQVAVTAVPDPTRGERLVVLHTRISKTPDELRERLKEDGLPCLFIPSADSFHEVERIPVLGSGKFDLRAIKKLAQEAFPAP